MKQVLQNLKTGETEVADIPDPHVSDGHVLIRTHCSLISAGTERMLVEFGKGNLLQKARQQPDKVKQALEKIKTDGLAPTLTSIRNKLDQPLALGYCNAGEVLDVGSGVSDFAIGDRVASNGNHAELVSVPVNLCAKIPGAVDDETAAYTVAGSIALQGIRLADPNLGETVAVIGLGLIGLLTVQLLRAQGCRVLAVDLDTDRLELARGFGAHVVDLKQGQNFEQFAENLTSGQGVDAVIITASTESNEPVSQAARACRKRGRIILVGVTGLELNRSDFYEKELTFQVSCSYGPGRYDPYYEEKGQDYPIGFVRWTEQRNFQAVLDIMAEGKLNTKALTSHYFPVSDAQDAYDLIYGKDPSLGIILTYPTSARIQQVTDTPRPSPSLSSAGSGDKRVGFIGAGNYAGSVLIPAFKAGGAVLSAVVSQGGVSAFHAARKYGFDQSLSAVDELLHASDIQAAVITTRHDSHAQLVVKALKAGKHVFVEKPLCLTPEELGDVRSAYYTSSETSPSVLMVGFNRRFAPQIRRIKSLLEKINQPKSFIMTVNAGYIPSDHWIQDREIGGGRIVGECCHFIDLLRFLAGSGISSWHRSTMGGKAHDSVSINLNFENGCIGTIHYFTNGSKSFPKERLEVFAGSAVLQLDNFRKLRGYGWPGFSKMNLLSQDKGQRACVSSFLDAISGGSSMPIPIEELFEVSRISIEVAGT